MGQVVLLLGKSGSGKDFFVKTFNKNPVVSRTTRDKRKDEVNTIDKHFCTVEDYYKSKANFQIMAETKRNDDYYWIHPEDIVNRDIYIIDKVGVESLKDYTKHYFKSKFKVIYLKVNVFKRIRNMLKRGDKIKDIFKRVKLDYKEFKGVEKMSDVIVKL